ncbi:hypothetical protein KC19_6G029500 [Ceratodon purpureus]|nr:hypothetical protein KC19_6G029500 [Ceratodon purpureus]
MSRKYMTMQDLARMQAEADSRLTQLYELNKALTNTLTANTQARKLLSPSAVREDVLPLLCQSPGMECLPGEEVRCEMGRHEGCDCGYIRACFPQASECTFFNVTHIASCGF